MSTGRFAQRGWAFQSFAFRTWGLAGADTVVSDPSQSGWITKTATRHFVTAENKRLFRCEPQARLWIAKVNNE